MNKKRILFVTESSFLSTGFAVYSRNILNEFYKTGKYEIFELGCYGQQGDLRESSIPWNYMSNMPAQHNESQQKDYDSDPINQFGKWKFEQACLWSKPDIVCTITDAWMADYIENSPFRNYFKWIWMVTCDAMPQNEKWISTYSKVDAVLTYTDWAKEILDKQSNNSINTIGSAPPGADLSVFRPYNKKEVRENIGLDPDSLIVGMISRNQKRKLYPDLLESFALFLKTAPKELAQKTYLYLHTSWPDVGWDLPQLMKEYGVSSKVLYTYYCNSDPRVGGCGLVFPSFFSESKTFCKRCGKHTAMLANTQNGVPPNVLAQIINSFDVYVQYANSEGAGMGQMEAAACGVPIMATDYSAMSDIVKKANGIPIKVLKLLRESETGCFRAIPDNEDFVDKLTKFLLLPSSLKHKMGTEARRGVEKHFTYKQSAKQWMQYFDSVGTSDWKKPANIFNPARGIPDGLSNEEFVTFGLTHIAGRPDLIDSFMALRMSRDLDFGSTVQGMGGLYFSDLSVLGIQPRVSGFSREDAFGVFNDIREKNNKWETIRSQNNVHQTTTKHKEN